MKQLFSDTGQNATQNSNPWAKRNKWDDRYGHPVFLPTTTFQTTWRQRESKQSIVVSLNLGDRESSLGRLRRASEIWMDVALSLWMNTKLCMTRFIKLHKAHQRIPWSCKLSHSQGSHRTERYSNSKPSRGTLVSNQAFIRDPRRSYFSKRAKMVLGVTAILNAS